MKKKLLLMIALVASMTAWANGINPDLLSRGFDRLGTTEVEGNTLKCITLYGGGSWIFNDYFGINLKELGYGGVTIEYEKPDDGRNIAVNVEYYCEHIPGKPYDMNCQFVQESDLTSGKITLKFKDLPVVAINVMSGWSNNYPALFPSPENPAYITIKSAKLIPVSEMPYAASQSNTTTVTFDDFDEGYEFNNYEHFYMLEWGYPGFGSKVSVESEPTGATGKSLKCIPEVTMMASFLDVNFPEEKTVADLIGVSFDAYWESNDIENNSILLYIGDTALELGWSVGFMNDKSIYFRGNPTQKVGEINNWFTNTVLIKDIFDTEINTAINEKYSDNRPGNPVFVYKPDINKVSSLNKVRFGVGFGNPSAIGTNINTVYYLDNIEFLFNQDNVVVTQIDSTNMADFSWTPIADAASYCLTIYKNSNRTEPVYIACFDADGYPLGEDRLRSSGEGFNHSIRKLDGNTLYYYDLAAYNSEDEIFNQTRGFLATGSGGTTSVAVNQASTFNVYAFDHIIVIENANVGEEPISVYNTTGQIVANARTISATTAIPVPHKGIYIVKVGGKAQKVLVK